ncbi:MAG: hypothetical protein HQL49_04120 [Gammaproteobacteria bacterium]|nr:hypothetical protein [Gammaproteobacteria bacterium]
MEDINTYNDLTSTVRHFDRAIRWIIKIQDRLGARIKVTIYIGLVFLVLIGVSIFFMLYTMATQVTLISQAVHGMNESFIVVTERMQQIDAVMLRMEQNVAYLPQIGREMPVMDGEMREITERVESIRQELSTITNELASLRQQSDTMSVTAQNMDQSVQQMNREVARMAQPARSVNKIFPFP